jgi:hypothetical protein
VCWQQTYSAVQVTAVCYLTFKLELKLAVLFCSIAGLLFFISAAAIAKLLLTP